MKIAANMTWLTIKHCFDQGDLVLIPLGAGCKEHGLHLPMNADQLQAEYFAQKIAEKIPCIIMPTITDGYFPAFVDYAGSTSLSIDLSSEILFSKCQQWHQQGARAFYVLNYGISTNQPLAQCAKKLNDANIPFAFSDLTKFYQSIQNLCEQDGGTHADEVETSIMLFINPESVNLSKAKNDFQNKSGALTPYPTKATLTNFVYSPTGAFGDPTLATEAKGQIFTEKLLHFLLNDIIVFNQRLSIYS